MFGSGKKSARLGQWDGRRRSTRADDPLWPRLWRRPALRRLTAVLLTVAAATALVIGGGPPMAHRVGEVPARDLRARTAFFVVNQPQTEQAREEAGQSAGGVPHLPPFVVETYAAGAPLARRGEPITEGQYALLHAEHRAYLGALTRGDRWRRGTGMCLIVLLLAGVIVLYVARFQHGLAQNLLKITHVCALAVVTLALALWLCQPPWYAALVPLTATALVIAIAFNPPFALLMAFSLALMLGVARGHQLGPLLVWVGGQATAILLLREVRTRTRLVEVSACAGLACAAMTLATGLLGGQRAGLIGDDAGRNFLACLLAGFLVSGSLPLLEWAFGIVTDVSLRELADGSHPLLQELIRRAPGTYTHSMTVATLAEAAAEAIGANPLLARVGSYFHDVGKMLKPHYFIENQLGPNRHDHLEPALSTLVIVGHVKDGTALAAQYGLPRPIADFIQQHHGTTLVEYFYREAMRLQEANGHGYNELEFTFRYPGPKPQTREAGILMLADAVESASRALTAPAPGSIRKLVRDLVMKRLLDGQLEESQLTLTELHWIEESLAKGLIALFHNRIKYPGEEVRGNAS